MLMTFAASTFCAPVCAIAMAVAFILAPSIGAAEPTVATCQSAIDKVGLAFLNATIRAEQACFKRLAQGKSPPQTRCRGDGSDLGPISDPNTLDRILRAQAKAASVIRKRCAGIDLFAAPPDGIGFPAICPAPSASCTIALDGLDAVVSCLICAHLTAAQSLVGVQHPIGTGALAVVDFTFDATTDLEGFQVHASYPLAKGAFRGTGENVACSHSAEPGTIFLQNHQDANRIVIFLAAADQQTVTDLAFPIEIQCLFDVAAGQSLADNDIVVTVDEVVVNGTAGDPSALTVAVSVDS
jgi:hypothetical protein